MPAAAAAGLFFIPLAPNAASAFAGAAAATTTTTSSSPQSPSATLISHISRKFPAQPLPAWSLDHRLLVDTSSLLPGSKPAERRYTQFLTLSHLPGKTFVGTSTATTTTTTARKNDPTPVSASATARVPSGGIGVGAAGSLHDMSLIAIPTGFVVEDFFNMILRKMQPLWARRSAVRIDNGTAFQLGGGGDNNKGAATEWRVRIGDLKVTEGVGVGNIKGVLVEVESFAGDEDEEDEEDNDAEKEEKEGVKGQEEKEAAARVDGQSSTAPATGTRQQQQQQTLLRAFFDTIVAGSGVNLEGLRSVVRSSSPGIDGNDNDSNPTSSSSSSTSTSSLLLVRLYMELLRFARSG